MFPWGTSSCAPPRIRRLTFFCSCRRMSSQRKDQEYKRPARTTAGIRVCPSVWLVSLSACEVRAPSPSLPREARAAGLAPSDGWQRHDRAPAPSGTSPGAVLTPRSPGHRRGHATGRAGCQRPANPALQGLYAVTSPGAARDIITTGLARRPCGSRHLPRYGRPGVTTPAQLPAPPHRRPAPGLPSVAQALTAACYDITR